MRAITIVVKTAVLIALLSAMSAYAVKYVAVVETELDAASGASDNLNPAEVRQITAELRRVAVKNLPQDRYNVMTSETVQSMGGAVLEECAEENCMVILGSKIGADYIVRGIISKFGTKLTLSVEMYETENGMLVVSSEPVRSENKTELLEMAGTVCGEMYVKFAGGTPQKREKRSAAKKEDKKQAAEVYTTDTYSNYPSESQIKDVSANPRCKTLTLNKATGRWECDAYKDFTGWQRFGTGMLNYLSGQLGAGSFAIMKDWVGGSIVAGTSITGCVFIMHGFDTESGEFSNGYFDVGLGLVLSSFTFSIYRSATYHKPKPKSSAAPAAAIKPYDGLKLAILPTESGDFKVYARYDYSF